uniref:Exo-alpha-sialidase n=1 Tax=Auxenochlorella protothecoides TaxID=3075 RepID=A0A1D1ZYC9_AUXPR
MRTGQHIACLWLLLLVSNCGCALVKYPQGSEGLHNQNLVEVSYSPAGSGVYLGSPSLLVLHESGRILCSHDTFPDGETTYVLESKDGGATWQNLSSVAAQYWSNLFMVQDTIYLMGTTHSTFGAGIALSESSDGGSSWRHAVLFEPPSGCSYSTGAVPVLDHGGLLYRGFEMWCGSWLVWPQAYQAFVVYANRSSTLLDPASWTRTEAVAFTRDMIPEWMPSPVVSGGFLEGNTVLRPDGRVSLLMRCRVYNGQSEMYSVQEACLLDLTASTSDMDIREARLSLRWQGHVFMPGGGNKFTVRYDVHSRMYLSLTNPSIDRYGVNPDARNVLVLVFSQNLVDWRIATTVLVPNDGLDWEASLWFTGYQYVDWQTDGPDIVMAVRTAYQGAHSFHDSNRIAFKRLQNYMRYLPVAQTEVF